EFEPPALPDARVAAFRERVKMLRDDEVDAPYPRRWIGKVEVRTTDGRTCAARVEIPKGDPGNPLSRAELEEKAIRLAQFRGAANEAEMRAAIERIRSLDSEARVGRLITGRTP